MANIVYEWNPFQERIDNRVNADLANPTELIRTGLFEQGRVEFVPRGAPFFTRGFNLYRQGSPTPLKLGYDYCFAHYFDKFTLQYNRNGAGSIVMLRPVADDVLIPQYDIIGGPLTLDEVSFAALVANIVNAPRVADWADLDETTVPTAFPPDPHPHPASQTYDYDEMMSQLKSLILSITDSAQGVTLKGLLEAHLDAPLIEAHAANKGDIGMPLTPNMMAALKSDLAGNSANLLVTVDVLKEAFRKLADGSLNLGDSDGGTNPSGPPSAPTVVTVNASVKQNSTGNVLSATGGVSSDNTAITYTLTQSGGAVLTFNKTSNIQEGEQVTFSAPAVDADTTVTISVVTVDTRGRVSPAKTATLTVSKHTAPTTPTYLNVPATIYRGSFGNPLTVGGSSPSDGATVTYSLFQTGTAQVQFSKSSNIQAGEQVTFSVGDQTPGATVQISAFAIDSQGSSSQTKSASVVLADVPGEPGVAFGGGYYVGRMLISGIAYALVVAPKASGEFPVLTTKEACEQWAAMLTIGGYKDWILPSFNMTELLYRTFKPNTTDNATTLGSPYFDPNGINPESVPKGKQYTISNPPQTSIAAFKAGGPEEFKANDSAYDYWSTTRDGRYVADRWWMRFFLNGGQVSNYSGYGIARAVRLVRLGTAAEVGPTAPNPVVDRTVPQGSIGNVIIMGGAEANDGATLTYNITQSGPVQLTFSKMTNLTEGEKLTFNAPAGLSADTPIQFTVQAVAPNGQVSTPRVITVNVVLTMQDGALYGGGHYIGLMTAGGKRWALILSPFAGGQFTAYLKSTNIAVAGADSSWDGLKNTIAISGDPLAGNAAKQARALSIGGYLDWAVPADDQLDLIYRKAKPTSTPNDTRYGVNNSITPAGVNYTPTAPAISPVQKFQSSGKTEGMVNTTTDSQGNTNTGYTFMGSTLQSPTTYNIKDFNAGAVYVQSTQYTSPCRVVRMVELKLSGAPLPPNRIVTADKVAQGTTGNPMTILGALSAEGTTFTYSIAQSGNPALIFSKMTGIQEGEKITYSIPAGSVTADTPVQVQVTAVDSTGKVSTPLTITVTVTTALRAGMPYGGGFYVGRYKDFNGKQYDLVVSSKLQGGEYVANTYFNGSQTTNASDAYVSVQMPPAAFQQKTGFSDWQVPDLIQSEMLYRFFKPSTVQNLTTGSGTVFVGGSNQYSVPEGPAYTATVPAQTTLDAFKTGGPEAFDQGGYATSSKYASNGNYSQNFINGSRGIGIRGDSSFYVRAVRSIPVAA